MCGRGAEMPKWLAAFLSAAQLSIVVTNVNTPRTTNRLTSCSFQEAGLYHAHTGNGCQSDIFRL